ncbi:COR domain-containing protein [Gloeothece verrucosa]|uniref:non-specific serine/threonine protein kinase n=1 Tax=Gloeothece verrucosa (strain PCC 7822) TaxID=497965 RepID=E0UBI6_GLOV7|nr:COR domain-containing protein [Gloeothece verrucosa]ADN12818.1 small GTP-binding protein [Gloeothece verrucosa PCC 7822]
MTDEELQQVIQQAIEEKAETLDLSFKKLETLPPEIGKLTALRYLDLRNNKLTTLPSEIGKLINLTSLNLTDNQLTALPPEIGKLSNLSRLHLSYNKLTSLPPEIGQLTILCELYLSHNHLETLPFTIENLVHISRLSLSYNQLTTLPSAIKGLMRLSWLDLNNNQLTTLPPEIGQLNSLNQLDVGYNQLTTLPPEIGQLLNLISIDVSYNKLTSLPPEIGQLLNLDSLTISNNQLTILPPEIGYLSNLISLNLSYNKLSSLPPEIGQLTKLIQLRLSHNQLQELPAEIGHLTQLTSLVLKNNQLLTLPFELIQLVQFFKLTQLDLQENLLSIPPEIIWRKDEPDLIVNFYLHQLVEKKQSLNEAKVLLVGEGSVGKTSLMRRLLYDSFTANQAKTDGINIVPWNLDVNGNNIKLNVWDFGGQEIYHATHQFFLTKRSLYILVINNRQSEEQNRIEYWLKLIQTFGGDSPIIIVGNRRDEHLIDVNQPRLQEKYKNIKAFIQTSCKTGDGIQELRQKVIEEISQLKEVFEELRVEWLSIKKQLENLKGRNWDYIPYTEYQMMCQSQKITDDQSQRILIRFLHDLGVVLNFQEDVCLEDTTILNPSWVTKGVYRILNDNTLMTHYKGILLVGMLDRILDNPIRYPRDKHQFIINIMCKFELCFKLEGHGEDEYLIPDLLPKAEQYTGEWDNALAFQYHYQVLPSNIISRFMVKLNHLIYQQTYWRTGVVLCSHKNKALVKADREDKKIFIWIKGPEESRAEFRQMIRSAFESIHQTISGIQFSEKIVLPHREPAIVIDYQYLLNLNRLGEQTFIPQDLEERVNVKEIIDYFDHAAPSVDGRGLNHAETAQASSKPSVFEKNIFTKTVKLLFSNNKTSK